MLIQKKGGEDTLQSTDDSQLVLLIITIIIIIINDIYPGSSTHLKVVFREVLHPIKLEFGNVDFSGESKTGELGEKPLRAE